MKRLGRFILALLRELADESAYQRHLAAHGRAHEGAGHARPLRRYFEIPNPST
jgi:hypothetical protein